MEGIAALSLACNIVQLVGSADKAIRIITQVYQNGQTKEYETVESATQRLRDLCNTISFQANATTLELQFQEITRENIALAEELIQELSKLKGQGSAWTKFKTGIKAVRKRSTIEKLQQRLSACERSLNTVMLATLLERNEAFKAMQGTGFDKLDSVLRDFIVRISEGRVQTIDLIKTEHTETRALILQTKHALTSQFDSLEASRQRTQMMNSLRYPEMNARLNQIDEASPGTYDSFFDLSGPYVFAEWFRAGDGIMWIQGKAGSGKSTLMKFIAQSPTVREFINARYPSFAVLHHFFWLSGTSLQRDFRGLLYGLVYQLIQLLEDFPHQDKRHIDDWSVQELEDSVLGLLKKLSSSKTVIIVIDALDEYGEQSGKRKLVNLITKLSKLSRVCVSSRPESFWLKHLSYTSHIKLENITLHAIRVFIEQELGSAGVEGSHQLVEDLASRADGVFLWAFLAVKDVLRGLDSNATQHELQQRIKRLPKGMENLYTSMLHRIEEDWPLVQQEAAVFFSTALFLHKLRPIVGYGIRLHDFHATSAFLLRGEPVPRDPRDFEKSCTRSKERLILVCAGMLQVHTDVYADDTLSDRAKWALDEKVEFSHRTVRDFLIDTPTGRRLTAFGTWDVESVMCKLPEVAGLIHSQGWKTLKWISIYHMLRNMAEIRDRYELDERSHLRMILSIRQLLEAINPSNSQRVYIPIEFEHSEQILESPSDSRCGSVMVHLTSRDLLGMTLESGTMCYFNSLCLELEQFTLQYLEYLLFCSVEGSFPRGGRYESQVYCQIWKLMEAHGVTGNLEFGVYHHFRDGKWLLEKSSANMTIMSSILDTIQHGYENEIENVLKWATGSSLRARDLASYFATIDDCWNEESPLLLMPAKDTSALLYIEGNTKYWLSVTKCIGDIRRQLLKLGHLEDYEAISPHKRLRFIMSNRKSRHVRGVPIFIGEKLFNHNEDGETLLQLWETSQRESPGSADVSEQAQKAMEEEAERLILAAAPYVSQARAQGLYRPVYDLEPDDGLVDFMAYQISEGILYESDELFPRIPVFKDQLSVRSFTQVSTCSDQRTSLNADCSNN